MRFLHTSDWHLGRGFHGVGLLDHQAVFVDHLVEVVRSERLDAVVISGDVYDRALPSPDAVRLLDEALTRLAATGAQVVLSSGNHDSAVRLGFASGLLSRAGVHLCTSLDALDRPVLIGDTAFHGIPYLEPAVAAGPLGVDERTHAAVLRAAMVRVRASRPAAARHQVVLAHAFVTGGAGSDSERDISVGGVSAVPPSVFDGVGYAALGHLHGQQQVGDRVRYSGSPLAMSFGEVAHRKGSLIVDLGGAEPVVESVAAPVPRPLAVLRGTLDDLLGDPRHAAAEGAWCQITLTDPLRPLGAMDRVRARFPHTLELRFDPQGGTATTSTYTARVAARSEVDVCCDFLAHVRGGHPATRRERDLLRSALQAGRVARGVSDDEGVVAGAARPGSVGAA